MKTIYNLMLIVLSILMLGSCKKDEMELDKGSTPLKLEISEDTVVLSQFVEDKEAVKFSWGAGSNQGTGAAISYLFEMDLKDNNFAGGIKKNIGKTDSHFISYTNKELNDSLKTVWNIPVDDEETYTFEARVTAVVSDPSVETQISNVVVFDVQPYKYRNLRLYLIGDATPGGWNIEQATLMTMDAENKDVFTWEGTLKADEFRFVCQSISGMFWPGYAKDANADNKMIYFETQPSSEQDKSFDIKKPGKYKITANTSSLDVNIQPISVQEPDPELYLIGGATPGGWEIMNAKKMSYNAAEKTFEWNDNLNIGDLRFICQQEPRTWWPGYVMDPEKEGKAKYFNDYPAKGEDIKFIISEAGKYYVSLNTETLDVVIRKQYENVWVYGDATPGGWTWENMGKMTQSEQNGNIFTWTGDLKAGQIKFSLDGPTVEPFTGYFVYATKTDASIFNDTDIDIRNSGEDRKWKLTEQEAGTYTITINFNTNKISFEKQN